MCFPSNGGNDNMILFRSSISYKRIRANSIEQICIFFLHKENKYVDMEYGPPSFTFHEPS